MKPARQFNFKAFLRVVNDASAALYEQKHVAQLGRDIRIHTHLLEEYCFAGELKLTHDLVCVLGAVRWRDRLIKRRHSEGWGASNAFMRLTIPLLV